MKRLRRIIFNGLTVLSLLLCVATVVLWVRSRSTADVLSRCHSGNEYVLRSGFGSVSVGRFSFRGNYKLGDSPLRLGHADLTNPVTREAYASMDRMWGFKYERQVEPGLGMVGYRSRMPDWFLIAIFAAMPALCAISLYRARRRNHVGLCPSCNYDLRATPERCPECGTAMRLAN
jgi:hypothetical protein